jgi:hypothetical protein
MILPAYSLSAGIDSVPVTMHVPRFVSIVSPGWGGVGSSTWSKASKFAPSIVMMYRYTLRGFCGDADTVAIPAREIRVALSAAGAAYPRRSNRCSGGTPPNDAQ